MRAAEVAGLLTGLHRRRRRGEPRSALEGSRMVLHEVLGPAGLRAGAPVRVGR
ncbi:hypothetical protein GCM10009756_06580 [Pseudokineococcus marinus]